MITLADRLRSLRKESGKTLREVAPDAGVTIGHISEMENGQVMPSILVLEKIADAYGLTVSDLMQGVRVTGPMPLSYDI